MDRHRLDIWTVQANALATALAGLHDSENEAKQRCINYSGEIRGCVKAWSNLAVALDDPQLEPRHNFVKLIDRILTDNSKIVNDLRTQLALIRNKQEEIRTEYKGKKWSLGRKKSVHLLVNFLGGSTTILRLQQIIYAASVLDVILGVVLYAKALGVEPATEQDAQALFRDQFTRLRAEKEAKALVYREERRVGEKGILASLWLSTVTWHLETTERPPFENLALQWFETVTDDMNPGLAEQVNDNAETQNLTRLVLQLQNDMREQASQAQRTRTWAETSIRELMDKQLKTEKDAATRIEELRNQLEVQQIKIDSDTATIERLDHARKSWSLHAQKQTEKVQQIETEIKTLQEKCLHQQNKIDTMQLKQEKLIQQNQILRQRLEQAETEKDDLAKKYYKLQTRHSEVVRRDKQWTAYHESTKDRDVQIKKLLVEVKAAHEEIDELKLHLVDALGARDQLRNSLTEVEGERDEARRRADTFKARLSTPRRECPSSFDNRQPRRESHSRQRSDSVTSSPASRTTSRQGRSRSSSRTYVDDSASDREYYDDGIRRKRSSSKSSKVDAWFSPMRRQEAKV